MQVILLFLFSFSVFAGNFNQQQISDQSQSPVISETPSSVYAEQSVMNVTLDQDQLFLGSMNQLADVPSTLKVLLKRVSNSPEKIVISFHYQTLERKCWDDVIMLNVANFDYSECLNDFSDHIKTLVLDFKKGYTLKNSESETFLFTVVLNDIFHPAIGYKAEGIDTKGPYQIKSRKSNQREGLSFKKY